MNSQLNLNQIHSKILEWLSHSREKILNFNQFSIDTKSNDKDLVTTVDKTIEADFKDFIQNNFPDHQILGEESYASFEANDSPFLWVIDPIDGTANFVKMRQDYCVMLAFFIKQEPQLSYIYDIYNNHLYYAIKGQGVFHNDRTLAKPQLCSIEESFVSIDRLRTDDSSLLHKIDQGAFDLRYLGCSGLDGARVLEGKFAAFVNPKGGPWDYAPFILMAQELDLKLCAWSGERLDLSGYSDFFLGRPEVYQELFN
ncbi:inositol monophosphatase family protein [Ignavigranum ruoffiae]|uniref:inositol monophosphatase family protein n=1 Tax=Ignavigranum ruoffiae TaxID=89093 RepID=UPI002053E0CF|nr:inositol monophosphatase family protein [Ignavigranum ruoffiae]UPQ86282.1 inositol monophosphatase family protein [Ignavigranum ruoffiae]